MLLILFLLFAYINNPANLIIIYFNIEDFSHKSIKKKKNNVDSLALRKTK